MAEEGSGGTKTSSEIEAIESLDTQLAKRKELLKLQQEDAALMRDKTAQLQIQADIQKNDLTLQSQKIKALRKRNRRRIERRTKSCPWHHTS